MVIAGFIFKLNSMKLVSLIGACVCALLAILGLAYIGAYMSDDKSKSHSDAMKSMHNGPGVYIFGTSVSSFYN